MKTPLQFYSMRKVIPLIMICAILGVSVSWVIAEYTPKEKGENLTPQDAAVERARQFFMQTHAEPIDHIYVDCVDASIPSYKIFIFYPKWENGSDGDFLFDYRIDYFAEPTKIEPGPIPTDTCYSWVLRYIGSQPIISQVQANQTFFMLVKRSPFSNWAIYLGIPALSINITETSDCYKESAMFLYAGVNCPNANLILSYDIYKNGTAVFEGQREILP